MKDLDGLSVGELRDLAGEAEGRAMHGEVVAWREALPVSGVLPASCFLVECEKNGARFNAVAIARRLAGSWGGRSLAVYTPSERRQGCTSISQLEAGEHLNSSIPAIPVPLAMIQDLLESLDQESHAARCKKWGQELKAWLESQPYFNWPPSQETQQEGNQE